MRKEAVGGCEERINAGHGGDRITIAGDLVACYESHEQELFRRWATSADPLILSSSEQRASVKAINDGRSM
jgi:hypothetical protein